MWMRTVGATLLAVIAVGCGSSDARSGRDEQSAARSSTSASPGAPPLKVGIETEGPLLELYRVPGEPACFESVFSHGYGEEPWVQAGRAGCIGGRAWFVLVGAGGQPGSVDWTLVVGATRTTVDEVVVEAESGREKKVTPEASAEPGWKTFAYRLDEPITSLSAYDSSGRLVDQMTIPRLVERTCDWLCEAQGPWGLELSSVMQLDPHEFTRHPDLEVISGDATVRETLAGQLVTAFGPKPWTNCAGFARGSAWLFMVERGPGLRRPAWPTVGPEGEPTTLEATGAADFVAVDIDRQKGRVVSILPYDGNMQPLVDAGIDKAPLATRTNNEEPLKSEGCRRMD